MLKTVVQLQNMVAGVLHRDRGATAVEYGMIVALIAAAIAGLVLLLGQKLQTIFSNVTADI